MSVLPEEIVAECLEDISDFDLTEEQQAELLQTLWGIMMAFVDAGIGVDSFHLTRGQPSGKGSVDKKNGGNDDQS